MIYKFLQGGGEMGHLFRTTNWAQTSLGTPDNWPDSLKTAVSISLNSGFPIGIYWGHDLTLLYNDAYRPIAGNKHPWAFAKPGSIAWAEIWDVLTPQFAGVMANGESVRSPDALLWMNRFGYTEECYFDYSLSPIIDIEGNIGGVFNAVIETTYKVITERRNKVLQGLLPQLNAPHTYEQSIRTSINILEQACEDIPLCLLYTTLADNQQHPVLTAQGGSAVNVKTNFNWQQAVNSGESVVIDNLTDYMSEPAMSMWDAACTEAIIAPISQGKTKVTGYMVMGVSPVKKLDDEYRHFLESAALHTGTILNNAYGYEQDLIMAQRLQQSEARLRQTVESEQALNEELLATNEELNQSQENLQTINRELLHSEKILDEVLNQMPAPIVVLKGPNQVIELANQSILDFWKKNRKQVIGRPMLEVFPELASQPFPAQWKHVFETGETIINRERPVNFIMPTGEVRMTFVDYYYQSMVDVEGNRTGVLATVLDVTDKVEAREKISKSEAEQQALNEELSAVNEEMTAANEELITTNEELTEAQSTLRDALGQLTESESRLRYMLSDAPIAIAVMTGPDFILESVNKKVLEAWGKTESIIGLPLRVAVPELLGQPFFPLLENVYTTGVPYYGNEVKALIEQNGKIEEVYSNFVYHPVKTGSGKTIGIILTAQVVTEQVQARKRIENSENRLKNMVMTTPIGMTVLRGRDLVIEIANQHILEIWNRAEDEVSGKPLLEVFPELIDQPFPKLLAAVFETGKPVSLPELTADIHTAQGLKQIYVDFSYDPLFDVQGRVEAILVTVIDITEIVEARKALEKGQLAQQILNDELLAINEAMTASNEELLATNEELDEAQTNLRNIIDDLAESEARFRYVIQQAPVAISILNGADLVLDAANDNMLRILGKTGSIVGKRFADALPEMVGQPFLAIIDKVFQSGVPYYSNEARAWLEHEGQLKEGYFNSIYHPLKDDFGNTTSIIIVASDVTEQVQARKELQQTEEMLRLSIEAANVGTWFMDVATRNFIPSARLKELFGFYAHEDVSFDDFTAQIPEEYRGQIRKAIADSVQNGANYNMEHPVTGFHDQKKRWVRGLGKLYPDAEGRLSHFSGMILDITEQKIDDIRKNDFIGMVSHELKTPLTSLSAYVQMLHSKAKKAEDTFTAGALEKVNMQVKRMSNMINGFLNVSRLESGKIMIDKQDFDLYQLLNETVDEARITVTNHFINIVPGHAVTVNADREKIGSVISNLLSNAVKYSPKGQNIEIKLDVLNNSVQVSVKDEGMGIKEQDLERLFERYYRVESNHTQHISGFGIGLYLSAEIIRRHDGKIWVESESGKGSTFYFTIPLN